MQISTCKHFLSKFYYFCIHFFKNYETNTRIQYQWILNWNCFMLFITSFEIPTLLTYSACIFLYMYENEARCISNCVYEIFLCKPYINQYPYPAKWISKLDDRASEVKQLLLSGCTQYYDFHSFLFSAVIVISRIWTISFRIGVAKVLMSKNFILSNKIEEFYMANNLKLCFY